MGVDIEATVISLLRKHGRNHPRLESDRSLSVRADLGLDGEDALEFINEFTEVFSVDMKDFDFLSWFGNEGSIGPLDLLRSFVESAPKKNNEKTLQVGDLFKIAQAKKWPTSLD